MNVMSTSIAPGGHAARTRRGPRAILRHLAAARLEIVLIDCKQRTEAAAFRPVS
jgi:hypothetical protein